MLNKKQTDEIADHRRVLDREIEAQSHLYEREMEKVRVKGRQELDTKVWCTVHSSVFLLLFLIYFILYFCVCALAWVGL